MKLTILFTLLLLHLSMILQAEDIASHNRISFESFTLPQSLISQNSLYIQHSMDIVMSDNQFELVIGKVKSHANVLQITLAIVETKNHFYGEVRKYDPLTKKFTGVVPLDFRTKDEAIEKIRIAITEALLGKKYVMDHLIEIKEKAKIQFFPNKKIKSVDIKLADQDTKLLSDKFDIKKNDIISPVKENTPTAPLIVKTPLQTETAKTIEQKTSQPSMIHAPPPVDVKNKAKELPSSPMPKGTNYKPQMTIEKKKISTQIIVDAFTFAGQLQITTEKNIRITTTIGHIGLGARVKQLQLDVAQPWVFMAELQIAKPIKRDDYSIPMWRKLEVSALKKNIYPYLGIGGGIEFEPLYFIALPNYGAGLTVIDNNIFWSYFQSEFILPKYGEQFSFALKFSKSLVTSSSTSTKLSGLKLNVILHSQLSEQYAFDINFQRSFLHDEENLANNQILAAFVRYKF